ADLAVLPEIPLNAWSPATKTPADHDAEPEGGPRSQAMAEAARRAKIGLVGGIIHKDRDTGRRTSRALAFDANGDIVARYEKLHLPEEPGFWETSHYELGTEPPHRIDDFGVPVGIQICSDNNRPEGTHLLGAEGALGLSGLPARTSGPLCRCLAGDRRPRRLAGRARAAAPGGRHRS